MVATSVVMSSPPAGATGASSDSIADGKSLIHISVLSASLYGSSYVFVSLFLCMPLSVSST